MRHRVPVPSAKRRARQEEPAGPRARCLLCRVVYWQEPGIKQNQPSRVRVWHGDQGRRAARFYLRGYGLARFPNPGTHCFTEAGDCCPYIAIYSSCEGTITTRRAHSLGLLPRLFTDTDPSYPSRKTDTFFFIGPGIAQVSVMGPCTYLVTGAVNDPATSVLTRVKQTYKRGGVAGFYPGGTAIAFR